MQILLLCAIFSPLKPFVRLVTQLLLNNASKYAQCLLQIELHQSRETSYCDWEMAECRGRGALSRKYIESGKVNKADNWILLPRTASRAKSKRLHCKRFHRNSYRKARKNSFGRASSSVRGPEGVCTSSKGAETPPNLVCWDSRMMAAHIGSSENTDNCINDWSQESKLDNLMWQPDCLKILLG